MRSDRTTPSFPVAPRLGVLCAAAVFAGAAAPPQEVVTPAEMHQIRCVAMELPFIRTAMERQAPPLLIISGRDYGPLAAPAEPCPSNATLPRNTAEMQFIRPNTAPSIYGPRGVNGALIIDLPPRE